MLGHECFHNLSSSYLAVIHLASCNIFNTGNSSPHKSLGCAVLSLFCHYVKIRISGSYKFDHDYQNLCHISTSAFQYSDIISAQWYNKTITMKRNNKDNARTCGLNIEAHLHNHCCSGRAISIKYSKCVFVALVTQHAK